MANIYGVSSITLNSITRLNQQLNRINAAIEPAIRTSEIIEQVAGQSRIENFVHHFERYNSLLLSIDRMTSIYENQTLNLLKKTESIQALIEKIRINEELVCFELADSGPGVVVGTDRVCSAVNDCIDVLIETSIDYSENEAVKDLISVSADLKEVGAISIQDITSIVTLIIAIMTFVLSLLPDPEIDRLNEAIEQQNVILSEYLDVEKEMLKYEILNLFEEEQ